MRDTTMNKSLVHWLNLQTFIGREDEDPFERDADGQIVVENDEQVLKDGWEYDDNDKPVRVSDDPPNDVDDQKARADALEESLKKERKLRRQAERDARKAAKGKADSEDEKDLEKLRNQLADQEARTKKLAEGLRRSAVDQAIREAARKLNFIDPTDALTDSIRAGVDVDQDEDDPSDIDIDMDSVRDAVKKLADKKKHLVGKGTPTEPSGGRFGRKTGGKQDSATDEAQLRVNYPGL